MKHITIVVPAGKGTLSTVTCIASTFEVFATANNYWMQREGKELFRIESAGALKQTEVYDGMFTLKPPVKIPPANRKPGRQMLNGYFFIQLTFNIGLRFIGP